MESFIISPMNKKAVFFTLTTCVFVLISGVFMYLHSQAQLEPVEVDEEVMREFDPTLDTSFLENLESRQANQVGIDLVY